MRSFLLLANFWVMDAATPSSWLPPIWSNLAATLLLTLEYCSSARRNSLKACKMTVSSREFLSSKASSNSVVTTDDLKCLGRTWQTMQMASRAAFLKSTGCPEDENGKKVPIIKSEKEWQSVN